MTDPEKRHRTNERRMPDERRTTERRGAERRAGERRLDTCPTCKGILNAKSYCYSCKKRVIKIA